MRQVPKYKNLFATDDGHIFLSRSGKLKKLRLVLDGHGYSCVNVKVYGKYKRLLSHRLVAGAFIPNPDSKPFVNHKNGIKNDNRVKNLEWCTPLENAQHLMTSVCLEDSKRKMLSKLRNGRGVNHPGAKLSEENVLDIRRIYESGGVRQKDLAIKYGVRQTTIASIITRQSWSHI